MQHSQESDLLADFPRVGQTLRQDRLRASVVHAVIVIATFLLAGWLYWFFFTSIPVADQPQAATPAQLLLEAIFDED